MITTTDRIYTIWQWCRDAYLQHGNRRLSLPPETDPTKTYQWRYLESLNKRFTEWGLSDKLCKEFIKTAVCYAKERKLLNKGLTIFLQNNILGECYERLRKYADCVTDIVSILRKTKLWIDNQVKESNNDLVALLLKRKRIGSYTNIVCWYQSGHISDTYLSLSRSCGVALAQLETIDKTERKLLPSSYELFTQRTSILKETKTKLDIKYILQDDWRKPC